MLKVKIANRIDAQVVYDLCELGIASGSDVHDFFREQIGVPSPKGNEKIDEDAVKDFVASQLIGMQRNSEKAFMETMESARGYFNGLGWNTIYSSAFGAWVELSHGTVGFS